MAALAPSTPSRSRFWHRFDRWALLVVVALQAAMLVSHGLRGRNRKVAGDAVASEGAAAPARRASAAARSRGSAPAIPTSPVCFGGTQRAPLSVDSACSMAAWDVLRRSPALDLCEHRDAYELRLSVPGGAGSEARAWVQDRQVEIEVPVADELGRPAGRLSRRVLLPTAPAADRPPRIEHTNGILRVFFAKP